MRHGFDFLDCFEMPQLVPPVRFAQDFGLEFSALRLSCASVRSWAYHLAPLYLLRVANALVTVFAG